MTTKKQNIVSILKGAGVTLLFFFLMIALYTKGTFKKEVLLDSAFVDKKELREALDNNFNRSNEILLQKFDSLLDVHYGTTTNTLKQ